MWCGLWVVNRSSEQRTQPKQQSCGNGFASRGEKQLVWFRSGLRVVKLMGTVFRLGSHAAHEQVLSVVGVIGRSLHNATWQQQSLPIYGRLLYQRRALTYPRHRDLSTSQVCSDTVILQGLFPDSATRARQPTAVCLTGSDTTHPGDAHKSKMQQKT